jgi:hypothetical protein
VSGVTCWRVVDVLTRTPHRSYVPDCALCEEHDVVYLEAMRKLGSINVSTRACELCCGVLVYTLVLIRMRV